MNINKLQEYNDKKLLIKQKHPDFPLYIWNYSPKVQYERLWDEITIKCRALVTDEFGNVVAKSFDKFFNLEEESSIPNEPYEIYEKIDGSLIVLFHYKNQLIISSKGSFTSEHAIQAKKIIDKYNYNILDKTKTYCFEMVAPWNRIVCFYPEEKLYLLAKFDIQGNEYPIKKYKKYFSLVNKYDFLEIDKIKETISDDREGVVVRFQSGKRIKIKGSEYVKLHKIVTNISEKVILDVLKENKSIDSILGNIPDEFYNWAKKVENKFKNKFNEILIECKNNYKELSNRKETANYFLKQKYPQVLFAILDKKDFDNIIWKIVEKNERQN